jgi:general secretion pathway protein G
MTMIEMLFVLIIIGTVASIATPRLSALVDDARGAAAIGDLDAMHNDIVGYVAQHDSLPPSLATIDWAGHRDPWNQPYMYLNFAGAIPGNARVDQFGVPLNTGFDIYSLGKDGSSSPSIMTQASQDDILIGDDGGFIGLATRY